MSKRYGRNQRRKHRNELALTRTILRMNADNVDHYKEIVNRTALEARQLREAFRRAQDEILEMVRVLRPVTEITQGVRPKVTIATNLTYTNPSVEARYKMDLEKLMILRGPEAQAALAFQIGKEIAEFFANKTR